MDPLGLCDGMHLLNAFDPQTLNIQNGFIKVTFLPNFGGYTCVSTKLGVPWNLTSPSAFWYWRVLVLFSNLDLSNFLHANGR